MDKNTIDKYLDQHKNTLRQLRKKKFEELDLKVLIALEQQNSQEVKRIADIKQRLRDVTNIDIDYSNVKDVEDIISNIPDILL